MKNLTTENRGVIFVLLQAAIFSLFPIFVNRGTQSIPPLTFAALATLIAACSSFFYALSRNQLHQIKNKKTWLPLLMITLFIVVIPYSLLFIGSQKTSGINTSIFLLSEIIFTLIFTHFFGEKTTPIKICGGLAIFLGAILVLFNGTFSLNLGDILIILSTLFYPIGNFYAKRALDWLSSASILFIRFLLGGLFIGLLAIIFEPIDLSFTNKEWTTILFTGIVLLGISKMIWYEGFKKLDISKAILINKTSVLFSLGVLIFYFKESISIYQGVGVAIMMAGVYLSIKRKSTDPKLTRYRI